VFKSPINPITIPNSSVVTLMHFTILTVTKAAVLFAKTSENLQCLYSEYSRKPRMVNMKLIKRRFNKIT
jgi:hypothetical protein